MVPERVCDFVCQTRRDLFKGLPCLRIIIIIPFTRTLDDQNSLVFVHFTLYLKSTNAIIVPLSHTRARTHTHFLSLSLVQLATRESFVDVLVSRVQCSGLSTFLRTYCTVGYRITNYRTVPLYLLLLYILYSTRQLVHIKIRYFNAPVRPMT